MSGISQTANDRRTEAGEKTPRKFLGFEVTLDWFMRPLFGFGLAAIAIAATYYGSYWFALFITAGAVAAAREWHRMLPGTRYGWLSIVSALAIIGATAGEVFVTHLENPKLAIFPWCILMAGAVINVVLSPPRRSAMLWHAASMLYVGVPALCLVAIRQVPANGVWELFALFFAVWLTDTGALFAGNLLKGPKLWPALSPNKTWSGAIGGAIAGTIAAAIVFAVLNASPWRGAIVGLCASVVGQLGDLFESFLKRRVGRKDSGSLIPGHGGVLDRIDSMLFVAPVAALVFLALHVDPFALVAP
ncbi:MAG TPA: phosphatidate cytidylyltransferase [Rhizomicrobium sp.]